LVVGDDGVERSNEPGLDRCRPPRGPSAAVACASCSLYRGAATSTGALLLPFSPAAGAPPLKVDKNH
jgi:hypothetical protein